MARAGGKCTDRLNRRGGTNPPTKNITQTQSRVKGMLLKIGIFLVAAGLVKMLVALVMRAKEKRGKA